MVAAKSGKVVISETLTGNIPNYDSNGNKIGSYRSYGEYIAILHDDGAITLYAHGKPGSRKVKVGQKVKQGQQIMNVGSTGNSTGPHLHFEVRTSPGTYSYRKNPMNYLP